LTQPAVAFLRGIRPASKVKQGLFGFVFQLVEKGADRQNAAGDHAKKPKVIAGSANRDVKDPHQ
jgi:hypothetical protein